MGLRARRVWQLGTVFASLAVSVTIACSLGESDRSANVEGGSDAGTKCTWKKSPTGAFGEPAPGENTICIPCEDHKCMTPDAGSGSGSSDAGSGSATSSSSIESSSFAPLVLTPKVTDIAEMLLKIEELVKKGELAQCALVLASGQSPDCTTGEWRAATKEELAKCAEELGKEGLEKALLAAGIAEGAAGVIAAAWIEAAKLGWSIGTWMANNIKETISQQACTTCKGNGGIMIQSKPTIWTIPRTASGYPTTCMVLQDDKGVWTIYAGTPYRCGWWWDRMTEVQWSRCGQL